MSTYMICDGEGNLIADGLSAETVDAAARLAETVYVTCDRDGWTEDDECSDEHCGEVEA